MEIIPRLSSSPRSLTFPLLANVFYTRITRFCRGCRRPADHRQPLSLSLSFPFLRSLGGFRWLFHSDAVDDNDDDDEDDSSLSRGESAHDPSF